MRKSRFTESQTVSIPKEVISTSNRNCISSLTPFSLEASTPAGHVLLDRLVCMPRLRNGESRRT